MASLLLFDGHKKANYKPPLKAKKFVCVSKEHDINVLCRGRVFEDSHPTGISES